MRVNLVGGGEGLSRPAGRPTHPPFYWGFHPHKPPTKGLRPWDPRQAALPLRGGRGAGSP